MSFLAPTHDCPLCPRLADFRQENRTSHPEFFNAPVPSFGELSARLLVVGLAPGLTGANATGRPFTGDYAGFILYDSLKKFGFAKGDYLASIPAHLQDRSAISKHKSDPKDNAAFGLVDCRITNAVRCVPPQNKPEPVEIKTCNKFLIDEIAAMPNLKVILSLGSISHNAVLRAAGKKPSFAKFGHGVKTPLRSGLTLVSSYHCSRYNINTKVLTQAMFDDLVKEIRDTI